MIAIIDYKMGNLGSILNMLKKIRVQAMATSDPKAVEAADKIILPGVGAFDNAMRNLNSTGLIPLLEKRVLTQNVPLLGICLGMQLLGQSSAEGQMSGLGWIDAETVKFSFDQPSQLKIPHMGWSEIQIAKESPLMSGLGDHARFYFVHSYHVKCHDQGDVLATAIYDQPFTAAVQHGNIMGAQFHPEKSHRYGLQLLTNFSRLP